MKPPRRTAMRGPALGIITTLLIPLAHHPTAWAQATEADFGYGSMRVGGVSARGERPLLLILIGYDETPLDPGSTPEKFRRMIAGSPAPPDGWVVRDFVTESSGGSFNWKLVGILGPYTINDDPATRWNEGKWECWWKSDRDIGAHPDCDGRPQWRQKEHLYITKALGLVPDGDFDFASYDLPSRDGTISAQELDLVIIGAGRGGGGIRRDCDEGGGTAGWRSVEKGGARVCGRAVAVGQDTPAKTIAHELLHGLGMLDLYGGRWRINRGLTAASDSPAYLDPWHTIQLGWVRPRIMSFPELHEGELFAVWSYTPELRRRELPQPVILYDPGRGTNEYYIVEHRRRSPYDQIPGVGAEGVGVWYVRTNDDKSLKSIDALIEPGPDGTLNTARTGGDDFIAPVGGVTAVQAGRNGILESQSGRSGDDSISRDGLCYYLGPSALSTTGAGPTPHDSTRRGQGPALWRDEHGDLPLIWFDTRTGGQPASGLLLTVGPLTSNVDRFVRQVTIKRIGGPAERSWTLIGHANKVVAMAAARGRLFAATSDNRLWVRDPVLRDVSWRPIGHANDVVAMAAVGRRLFAATRDNKLWVRRAVDREESWRHIGHANFVVAMASVGDKLFAATSDNRLWVRDAVVSDVSWRHIGHANNVTAMASVDGYLFASTRDNVLWLREAVEDERDWRRRGHANNVVAMTSNGRSREDAVLFAATTDDKLWVLGPDLP